MIDYYLFVTYVICVRVRNSEPCWGGGGLFVLCSYFGFTDCFFFIIGLLLIGVC